MKAIWNEHIIAESSETVVVEGNHYFPMSSVNQSYLIESLTQSECPWKGTASYYSIEIDGKTNPDSVWYYPFPKSAASAIAGHVAFWRGVEVQP